MIDYVFFWGCGYVVLGPNRIIFIFGTGKLVKICQRIIGWVGLVGMCWLPVRCFDFSPDFFFP